MSAKDGYVFSMSIRGANKELKDYVLNEDGYEWLGKEYKRKSRLYPRTIQVTATNGKKLKKTETGEILKASKALVIDLDKLKAEEALDGYYAIVTSEYEETADKIIDMYRGLWKIEESFRVTKSDLEAQYMFQEKTIFRHIFLLVLWHFS